MRKLFPEDREALCKLIVRLSKMEIKDYYFIKGVEGEFYPCEPTIFKKTYSEVSKEHTFINENGGVEKFNLEDEK